jgi:hypothetical protein
MRLVGNMYWLHGESRNAFPLSVSRLSSVYKSHINHNMRLSAKRSTDALFGEVFSNTANRQVFRAGSTHPEAACAITREYSS